MTTYFNDNRHSRTYAILDIETLFLLDDYARYQKLDSRAAEIRWPFKSVCAAALLTFTVDAEGIFSFGCQAFMAGDQTSEEIKQETGEYEMWEIVEREFVADEFRCPTCQLVLLGSDELDSAGLDYIHTDEQEREMEYEPDYGND